MFSYFLMQQVYIVCSLAILSAALFHSLPASARQQKTASCLLLVGAFTSTLPFYPTLFFITMTTLWALLLGLFAFVSLAIIFSTFIVGKLNEANIAPPLKRSKTRISLILIGFVLSVCFYVEGTSVFCACDCDCGSYSFDEQFFTLEYIKDALKGSPSLW